ncbi:hypothetical protein GCM10009827_033660 [Dactylosporangium maewongense]|uniref:Uncharacterized protein n=1 Tax=Dactylosporangium maewongense TaxID=634393 RepID=A0ABN2ACU8_9ACTN
MGEAAGVGGERREVLQLPAAVHLLDGGHQGDAGEHDDGDERHAHDEAELVDDAPAGPFTPPGPWVALRRGRGGGVTGRPTIGTQPSVALLSWDGQRRRALALGHEESPQASEIDNTGQS